MKRVWGIEFFENLDLGICIIWIKAPDLKERNEIMLILTP